MSFEHLKKGDTVALIIGEDYKIATVEKVNKLTLNVDGKKFYRSTGYQQGQGWNNWRIATVEDGRKHRAYYVERRLIETAKSAIHRMDLNPTPELINEIIDIIKREKAAQRSEAAAKQT